eukprot:Nk52_evm9s258 gene=Nk52_evmTU9s258
MSRLGVILVLAAIVLIVTLELQATGVKGEKHRADCERSCNNKLRGKFSVFDPSRDGVSCEVTLPDVMSERDCERWCGACIDLPNEYTYRKARGSTSNASSRASVNTVRLCTIKDMEVSRNDPSLTPACRVLSISQLFRNSTTPAFNAVIVDETDSLLLDVRNSHLVAKFPNVGFDIGDIVRVSDWTRLTNSNPQKSKTTASFKLVVTDNSVLKKHAAHRVTKNTPQAAVHSVAKLQQSSATIPSYRYTLRAELKADQTYKVVMFNDVAQLILGTSANDLHIFKENHDMKSFSAVFDNAAKYNYCMNLVAKPETYNGTNKVVFEVVSVVSKTSKKSSRTSPYKKSDAKKLAIKQEQEETKHDVEEIETTDHQQPAVSTDIEDLNDEDLDDEDNQPHHLISQLTDDSHLHSDNQYDHNDSFIDDNSIAEDPFSDDSSVMDEDHSYYELSEDNNTD